MIDRALDNRMRRPSWRLAAGLVVAMSACSRAADDGGAAALNRSGDEGVALRGQAFCGRDGEACCAVPLRECTEGGACNVDTGLCEAFAVSSALGRLCQSASDCPAAQTCCASGLLSQCVELAPNAACPTPDLEISAEPGTLPLVRTYLIEPLSCNSGCLNATGRHRTLGVAARVINRGGIDLLIGAPGDPRVRLATATTWGSSGAAICSEYSYAEDMVRYELIGADGSVYSRMDGRLSPGCLDWGDGGDFSCDCLGLPTGIYSYALGCLELPIDGVAPGEYTLRFTIDPDDRIAESDESNNAFESSVSLARLDALGECPPIDENSTDRLYGPEQECGWKPALASACTPGEVVSLGCPTCQGDPILRVCAGSEVCVYEDAVASNDNADQEGSLLCPSATFVCPAAGFYSSFVGAYLDEEVSCSVTNMARSTPPRAM